MSSFTPSFPGGGVAHSSDPLGRGDELMVGDYRPQTTALAAPMQPLHGPPPKSTELWMHMLGAVRRRLILLACIGALVAPCTAYLAWKLNRPLYQSAGLVRIAEERAIIWKQTDPSDPVPNYVSYMESQVLLIGSRRVLDLAMEDPVWRTTAKGVPVDPEGYFSSNLSVVFKPQSEFIEVSVMDIDPATAAAAVTSVINAYAQLYNSVSSEAERTRIGELQDLQKNLQGDLDNINSQIDQALEKYGTSYLQDFFEQAVDRVTRLKSAIESTEAAIAIAPNQGVAPAPVGFDDPTSQPSNQISVTDEQIAAVDPVMRHLIDVRQQYAQEIKHLRWLGYGPQHQQVQITQENWVEANEQVQQYSRQYRIFHPGGPAPADLGGGANPMAGKTVQQLRVDLQNLKTLYGQENAEMIQLGIETKRYQDLNQQRQTLSDKVSEVNARIEQLQIEGQLGSRLSIVSTGEIPVSPVRNRRLPAAALAGVVGFGLPSLLCALLAIPGTRRYSYGEDAQSNVEGKAPLLGIVPDLDDTVGEHEIADAAHSVHQIRVTLRSNATHKGPYVYLLTSSSAREGKTSLAMSLGLSFAAVHLRTLVMDCDLVGNQLTRLMGAQNAPGMKEALLVGSSKGLAQKVGANLHVLPVGKRSISANSLPSKEIRALLDEARMEYDVVLVDTGPVLGSIEAAVLAREVDGVVFTISRGQQRAVVERAVNRLLSLGARLEGFIFNRAAQADIRFSSYSYSSHRSASPPPMPGQENADMESMKEFGPLVQAVVAGLLDEH
jgi:polysaccharide biosynthesis transport protein